MATAFALTPRPLGPHTDLNTSLTLRSHRLTLPPTDWAPEVLTDGASTGALPRDLWALGVAAFVMLAGFHPFDPDGDATEAIIKNRIKDYAVSNVSFDEYIRSEDVDGVYLAASPEAKQLIGSMLRREPEHRLTVEELLQHPWICDEGDAQGHSSKRSFAREEKRRQFRMHTAKLRAACFAVLLQQQAADRDAERAAAESGGKAASQTARQKMRKADTARARMLDQSVLTRAFRAFDVDGKGARPAAHSTCSLLSLSLSLSLVHHLPLKARL